MATSHSNRLSSLTSLTRKPSTGSSWRLRYSIPRARTALPVGWFGYPELAIITHSYEANGSLPTSALAKTALGLRSDVGFHCVLGGPQEGPGAAAAFEPSTAGGPGKTQHTVRWCTVKPHTLTSLPRVSRPPRQPEQSTQKKQTSWPYHNSVESDARRGSWAQHREKQEKSATGTVERGKKWVPDFLKGYSSSSIVWPQSRRVRAYGRGRRAAPPARSTGRGARGQGREERGGRAEEGPRARGRKRGKGKRISRAAPTRSAVFDKAFKLQNAGAGVKKARARPELCCPAPLGEHGRDVVITSSSPWSTGSAAVLAKARWRAALGPRHGKAKPRPGERDLKVMLRWMSMPRYI